MKTLNIALAALAFATVTGSAALANENNYSADRAEFYATLNGTAPHAATVIEGRQAARATVDVDQQKKPWGLSEADALRVQQHANDDNGGN